MIIGALFIIQIFQIHDKIYNIYLCMCAYLYNIDI